jgi:flagellar protein FlaI
VGVVRGKKRLGLGGLSKFLGRLNPFNVLIPKRETYYPWLRAVPITAPLTGEILEKYTVRFGGEEEWAAAVHIVLRDGRGYYLVNEPNLTEEEQRIYYSIMEELTRSMRVEEELRPETIEGEMMKVARDLGMLEKTREAFPRFLYYVRKNMCGGWYIHVPLLDPGVEEISGTGPGRPVTVLHRRHYDLGHLETNIVINSEIEFNSFCQRLAQRAGKTLSAAYPLAEGAVREGWRFATSYGREVTEGPSFDIRKHLLEPLTLPFLISQGTVSPLMGAYLWLGVELRATGMIIGPTGSGKTSLLNSLLLFVPGSCKIATIEDSREISIPHKNWLPSFTRLGYSPTETRYDIDIFTLVRHMLRQRPDYLIVGETRGAEIRDWVHAAAVGAGCLSTFHADTVEGAEARWRSDPMNLSDASLSLLWWLALIRQVRAEGRVRRVVEEVDEVLPGGKFERKVLFRWDPARGRFLPSRAEEVARESVRLRRGFVAAGYREGDFVRELRRRAEWLEVYAEERRFTLQDFTEMLRRWRAERR